jgi:hypothetical protein
MRALLLIFFLFLFGCRSDEKVPKGILNQDEMRNVMWDLMRADAYVSDIIMRDSTRKQKDESVILYEKIFAIHSITQEKFKKSLAFYEAHPDLMKPISDSLRTNEKKAQEYQNYNKSTTMDSTIKKVKLGMKPVKQ